MIDFVPENKIDPQLPQAGNSSKQAEICDCSRECKCSGYTTVIRKRNSFESLLTISEKLEEAMARDEPLIVVECYHLGQSLHAWILMGNAVQLMAHGLSLTSLVAGALHRQPTLPLTLAAGSCGLQTVHWLVWGRGRTSEYVSQKHRDEEKKLACKEKVVLVKKPSTAIQWLRTALTVSAVGVGAYLLFRSCDRC